MFNEDKYNEDVNNAFKKMSEAQTPEEIKEILDNWPDRDNYTVENVPEFTKEEMEDMGYEVEDL